MTLFPFPTEDHLLDLGAEQKVKCFVGSAKELSSKIEISLKSCPSCETFRIINLDFSVSFQQPFPWSASGQSWQSRCYQKNLPLQDKVPALGGLCISLPNWCTTRRFCYTYWSWLILHHKPVTHGLNRAINGNFKKCLWTLSPAGDGAFTIRNGSAKSAQIHIFIKQFRCSSCSAFSFILICKAWLQAQLPRLDGDSAAAPHSHPWSLHRGNITYFPQGGKKG